jgi:hypothetical protein
VPRFDPQPPLGEGVSLVDLRAWGEAPLLLNLFLWAVVGLLALGGVQPTDGGWPVVLPFFGGISLLWILLWVFGVPNRVVVAPRWLARRLFWRWQVIRADHVAGLSVRTRSGGPPAIVVRDGDGRTIAISPRMARRPDQRDAVRAFLREASPRSAGGDQPVPARPEAARRRRAWRQVWRVVVAVAVLLNVAVGVLRLIVAFH